MTEWQQVKIKGIFKFTFLFARNIVNVLILKDLKQEFSNRQG